MLAYTLGLDHVADRLIRGGDAAERALLRDGLVGAAELRREMDKRHAYYVAAYTWGGRVDG